MILLRALLVDWWTYWLLFLLAWCDVILRIALAGGKLQCMNIMSLGDIDTKNEETTDTAYCWVRMARDSEFSFSKIYGAAARIVLE